MLIPEDRLILWTGLAGLPYAAFMVAMERMSSISACLIGVFAVIAVADALFALFRMRLFSVSVEGPVRLFSRKPGGMGVLIRHPPGCGPLRVGFSFPKEVEGLPVEQLVRPFGEGVSRLYWRLRGLERGRHALQSAHIRSASPLGLWSAQKSCPLSCELRVYPDLVSANRNLSPLFLRRSAAGMRRQRQIGLGREFDQLRDYVPGDGFGEIDWKATARKAAPITRAFQVEKIQEIYVAVDHSRLSGRPPAPAGAKEGGPGPETGQTILDAYLNAAMMLGLAAEQQGDLFGLAVFSEHMDGFAKAGRGHGHFRRCREMLYDLKTRQENPRIEEIFGFFRTALPKRALVFFLTCLDDPLLAEKFVHFAPLISRRHLVIAAQPASGAAPVFSDESAGSAEDIRRGLAGHFRWRQLKEVESALRREGVSFHILGNGSLAGELVNRYMTVRARQIL